VIIGECLMWHNIWYVWCDMNACVLWCGVFNMWLCDYDVMLYECLMWCVIDVCLMCDWCYCVKVFK
jgi:hypothetical protein